MLELYFNEQLLIGIKSNYYGKHFQTFKHKKNPLKK